jgi:DNA-binding CsgD family transcriptional regulator
MVRPRPMTRRLKTTPSPLRAVPEPAELMDAVERAAGIGVWRRAAHSNEMEWSDNLYRLLGYEPGERPPSADAAAQRMARSDAQILRADLARGPDEQLAPARRRRVLLPGGSVRVLEGRAVGGWRADESGRPVLTGTVRDITDELTAARAARWRRGLEELFRAWGSSPGDPGERILEVLARALGVSAASLWVPREVRLEPAASWAHEEPAGRAAFSAAIAAFSPREGVGLAGLAWESGHAAVLRAGSGPGATRLLPGGRRPVLAVPALRGNEVLAVLVFYSHSCIEGGEQLRAELSASRATLGVLLAHHLQLGRESALTARELEVLQLAADGLDGRDIERRLRLSRSTVKSHFENIYGKLAVGNRAAAVARGLRDGLIR